MASINVLESDLYQNGSVFVLDSGSQLLLRERYEARGQSGDTVAITKPGQDIRLLAFNRWKGLVARSDSWWWLIADRNNVFDPLFNVAVDEDGNEFDVMSRPVLIPNILKQKATF